MLGFDNNTFVLRVTTEEVPPPKVTYLSFDTLPDNFILLASLVDIHENLDPVSIKQFAITFSLVMGFVTLTSTEAIIVVFGLLFGVILFTCSGSLLLSYSQNSSPLPLYCSFSNWYSWQAASIGCSMSAWRTWRAGPGGSSVSESSSIVSLWGSWWSSISPRQIVYWRLFISNKLSNLFNLLDVGSKFGYYFLQPFPPFYTYRAVVLDPNQGDF